MFQLVILSVLLAGCYGNPFPVEERILNGTNAQPGEIPYIVTIQHKGRTECVGTILDSRHILAAAQCVFGACMFNLSQDMTIQYGLLHAGNSSMNLVEVNSTTCHENFEFREIRNDVAILTLKTDIPFSSTVKPLVLPKANVSVVANSTGMLSGWSWSPQGSISGDLKRVDLRVYSDQESESIYDNFERKYHFTAGVPGSTKGPCLGDAGSPIEVNGTVVGIFSSTYYMKPCGTPGYPGIFVRVANYVDWIRRQL